MPPSKPFGDHFIRLSSNTTSLIMVYHKTLHVTLWSQLILLPMWTHISIFIFVSTSMLCFMVISPDDIKKKLQFQFPLDLLVGGWREDSETDDYSFQFLHLDYIDLLYLCTAVLEWMMSLSMMIVTINFVVWIWSIISNGYCASSLLCQHSKKSFKHTKKPSIV